MILDPARRAPWHRLLAAGLIVLGAWGVRYWLLGALGMRATYLTFYPAVTLAALYGGLPAGLLATALSALFASYFWIDPVGHLFAIDDPADLLGMAVFLGSGALISCVAEAMHRARNRAGKAEDEASLAAEREREAASLRDSEARFRVMANTIQQLAWMAQADGYITWYNDRWYEYTGTTPEQMEGWGWQDVHDPAALPGVMERWKASIATGEPFDMVFPLRGADGRFRPFLTRGNPLRDGQGRVVQWFGTNTDIDEQKLVEQALRESRAQLETALSSMTDAVFISDAAGRFVHFNDAFATFHKFGTKEECAKTFDEYPDILDVFFDDGRPAPVAQWAVPRALRGETVTNAQYILRRKDTGETWVGSYSFGPILGPDGAIIGSVVVGRDVTERKRLEEDLRRSHAELETRVEERTRELVRMKQILDEGERMAGSTSWEWDLEANEFTFSENWLRIHGVVGAVSARLSMEEFMQFPHPGDLAAVESALKDTMGGGRPYDVTHRIVRRDDGQVRVVHARGELVADEAGRPARVRGWAQDITGLAATEEALRRANLALQAKHKELQDFFFIASHDLQEPLRTIQAFGQRLRSEHAETMGETGREYLWRMERAAGRMQALIQDLLAYSRVTSQGERPALADLGEIAREARGDLEQRIEEAGGRIDIGDLPTAEVDFVQMRQVFQNLFANAIKFRGSESLRVSVDAEKAVVNGRETARIAVRDNGIGFDEQFLDRIFEPFQRLHGKNAYEGTGIGLAIVRRILERHGGTIAARSAPGEGATFILSLPVRTEREGPRPDGPAGSGSNLKETRR